MLKALGSLSSLFRLGASLENPRYSLSDARAYDLLANERSASGVHVNQETALTCSPWYRGINLLADSVAKLPMTIFRKLPPAAGQSNGGRELARDHEWYFPLRTKIGEWHTPFEWKRICVGNIHTEGNAYSYIDRDTRQLVPIDPHRITPVVEDDGEQSRLWYVFDMGGAMMRRYHPDEILHFRGFSYDGLRGYSVVGKAKESLGLAIGARQFATVVFKNGARPSVVLTYPNKLSDPAKKALISQWERMYSGIENAHRTAILDMGIELKSFSGFSAEDAQLLQTRQFQIGDIANFLGVPPHKLGDKTGAGYNGLEQENLAFLSDTLESILTRIEEECEDKLLSEREKADDSHEISFDREKLILADSSARANYFRTALGGGAWMSVDEVRQKDGLNPVGMNDVPKPLNMGNAGGAPTPGKEPFRGDAGESLAAQLDEMREFMKTQTAATVAFVAEVRERVAAGGNSDPREDRLREQCAEILGATVQRCTRRVCHQARAAAEKPGRFPDWADDLRKQHAAAFHAELAPVERMAGEFTGRNDVNAVADWLLDGLAAEFLAIAETATAATLTGAVAAACERIEGELPAGAAIRFMGKKTE